jgi:hypothetical protein
MHPCGCCNHTLHGASRATFFRDSLWSNKAAKIYLSPAYLGIHIQGPYTEATKFYDLLRTSTHGAEVESQDQCTRLEDCRQYWK